MENLFEVEWLSQNWDQDLNVAESLIWSRTWRWVWRGDDWSFKDANSPELRPSARKRDQTNEGRSKMRARATECEVNSSRGSRMRRRAWDNARSLLPGSDMYFDACGLGAIWWTSLAWKQLMDDVKEELLSNVETFWRTELTMDDATVWERTWWGRRTRCVDAVSIASLKAWIPLLIEHSQSISTVKPWGGKIFEDNRQNHKDWGSCGW
jgi:hypothetical protein